MMTTEGNTNRDLQWVALVGQGRGKMRYLHSPGLTCMQYVLRMHRESWTMNPNGKNWDTVRGRRKWQQQGVPRLRDHIQRMALRDKRVGNWEKGSLDLIGELGLYHWYTWSVRICQKHVEYLRNNRSTGRHAPNHTTHCHNHNHNHTALSDCYRIRTGWLALERERYDMLSKAFGLHVSPTRYS